MMCRGMLHAIRRRGLWVSPSDERGSLYRRLSLETAHRFAIMALAHFIAIGDVTRDSSLGPSHLHPALNARWLHARQGLKWSANPGEGKEPPCCPLFV